MAGPSLVLHLWQRRLRKRRLPESQDRPEDTRRYEAESRSAHGRAELSPAEYAGRAKTAIRRAGWANRCLIEARGAVEADPYNPGARIEYRQALTRYRRALDDADREVLEAMRELNRIIRVEASRDRRGPLGLRTGSGILDLPLDPR